MSKFSDRIRATKPKFTIQVGSIDSELKNCLWNVFAKLLTRRPFSPNYQSNEMKDLMFNIYHSLFKEPADRITSKSYTNAYNEMRHYFFNTSWYNVYNLLEFSANNYRNSIMAFNFIRDCNETFERELSGYRFIGKQIAPITSQQETAEVEAAIFSPYTALNLHLDNAIRLLSDKTPPDFRNSIKESISAVEAICKIS